jgi:nitrite reductase/ring-hydroxylating ferredoxin subunit
MAERLLCRLDDITDGAARGFDPPGAEFRALFAVRRGDAVHVYVNRCPHAGVTLEFAKDRFLSRDGQRIICFAHGAQFVVETGQSLQGPCPAMQLDKVPARIVDGAVLIPADAGARSTERPA